MASVLRGTLIALTMITIIITRHETAVSVAVRSIIMIAMELAPQSTTPVMESVLKDILIAEVSAAMKSIIMIAMELAPPSIDPAMESALKV